MSLHKQHQHGLQKAKAYDPFDRFFRSGFIDLWRQEYPETVPSVNISERNDSYQVELAVPGMKKEDFNIDVDDDSVVTISCEKENQSSDEQEHYARREYNYSSFSRSFTIPENASGDGITAKYENGILKLSIPKKNAAAEKKISKIKIE